jgi:hypothetical protein
MNEAGSVATAKDLVRGSQSKRTEHGNGSAHVKDWFGTRVRG